jgi:hypothetical protein
LLFQRDRTRVDNATPGTSDDAALSHCLEQWVDREFPPDKAGLNRTFVKVEFEDRLRSYQKWSRGWRIAQISLWAMVTVLGLLISIFASFKTGHAFTVVFGAVVALLTTLTNALHPAQEADGYQDARLALRDQGWSLLQGTDAYADKEPAAQYERFTEQIRMIVKTKRASTRFTLGAPGPSDSD